MSKQAMKLALEALKSISEMVDYEGNGFKLEYEIKALEEALAKQEQGEPVAWMYDWTTSDGENIKNWTTSEAETLRDTEPTIITNVRPLYTTPQQHTWVGLTDDDKVLIKHDANFNQFMTAGEYADRVQQLTEARLKDLNT